MSSRQSVQYLFTSYCFLNSSSVISFVASLNLFAEQKLLLESTVASLKAEFKEEMQQEFSHMIDSRLKYFNPESSVASKYDPGTTEFDFAKSEKTVVRLHGTCMGCGRDAATCKGLGFELTCAHILSSTADASQLSSDFGEGKGYVDDIVLSSRRNYLLLCGTLGNIGSCHDAFDTRQISLFYSADDDSYKWYRMDELDLCFNAVGFDDLAGATSSSSSASGTAMRTRSAPGLVTIPEATAMNKYRRLLAWRTINLLIKAGNKDILKNRSGFMDYLKQSEENECAE